ncbi:ribosomal protein S18-alanine N-acetyltransferase [Dysgonomonas sp. Marseille-P4361]|uniref:ribosomal protein S18-alanine N-acetyltransferase n=1 Tax=Dysgonomonas sp. Marseille-P4361 TaxID=2161820 RepID=UPI000D55E759|nr:ribosomal protein S18-alanine N-acetyltransferase [Dysgonomonas sp. Marseille-P4361]
MDKFINTRQATLADLNQILKIETLSFEKEKFSREQFIYLISRAKGIFFVAEFDNSIVGYISLLQRSNSKNLRIYSIAVHPKARGQRIGQRLIDISKEFMKTKELMSIYLEVRTDNTEAIKLYNKNDFIVIDIIHGYYGKGKDAFKMRFFI